MRSSTSSSDDRDGARPTSRGASLFLVLLLIGVALFEIALVVALPVNLGRHEVDRCAALLDTDASRGRVLVLGDSVSYGAVAPSLAAHGVIDCTTNQAIGVAGNTFMVRRWLDARAERRLAVERAGLTVIYAVHPKSLANDLRDDRYFDTYFASVFLREAELASVRESKRPDLVDALDRARLRQRLTPPSNLRAGHFTDALLDALRGLGVRLAPAASTVPAEAGAQVRAAIGELARTEIAPSRESREYLERLASIADAAGIRLAIVAAPLPPSLRAAWDASGVRAKYDRALEALRSGHEQVSVHPCPFEPAGDNLFRDAQHLQRGAMPLYEKALSDWILEVSGID